MRWSHPDKLPNIKGVMDRFEILPRIIDRNRVKMNAAGAPCTYWRNASISALAKLPQDNIDKCYCWSDPTTGEDSQQSHPDRRHFLCHGTGYLPGYQKYGYKEIVLSTPSTLTKSTNDLVISGNRGSAYILSGNSQSATLTSERFTIDDCLEFDHFLVNDAVDKDQSIVEYYYSFNDTDWIEIDPISDYAASPIANKYGTFDLPEGTEYIRFRIRLRKRYLTSPSPKWNSIRFRYRKMKTLIEIDPRFGIYIPAFLAAREQESKSIEATEYGWTIKYPLNWWTLPEADIQNADVLMFLQGTYINYRFETKNLREFTYGESLQILHKGFESIMIRDEHSLLGIIHYLI